MVLLPGCFCCSSCATSSDFTRPASLSLGIDVVQAAASSSPYGSFSGVRSSYALSKYTPNQNYYFFNNAPGTSPDFSDVRLEAYIFKSQDSKSAYLRMLFPVGAAIEITIQCYAGVLFAYGSVSVGSNYPNNPGSVAVEVQGVPFNTSNTVLSASIPVLPIHVSGNFGYKASSLASWTLIPVDFSITAWLPFQEMT